MTGIDLLALPGSSVTALGTTLDVVHVANRLAGARLLDVRIVSTADSVALRRGVSAAARPLRGTRPRDVVIVPGLGEHTVEPLKQRLAQDDAAEAAGWVRRAWRGGATVAASCTGVFVLGQAGLLEGGRRCTTTWWLVPALKAFAPGCEPSADAMVVEHDRIWTAGAVFAHIDLMLTLLARLAGPSLAAQAAAHLVVEARPSQARFVAPSFLAAQDPLAGRIEALVRAALPQAPSLDTLAGQVGVSPRTLARRITAATGLSPMRFVQKLRMDTAIHLLQTTRQPIDEVAQRVGFEDASALYRLMRRHTGQAPSAFRGRPVSAGEPLDEALAP